MTPDADLALVRPGASIAYRRAGQGPPLLLLHATLSSSRQLRPLAARLAARFSVISVDRRGSGGSAPPADEDAAPIDVAVHIEDLAALLDAEGSGPCLVVGHSYGGCVSLELAARRPGLVRALWVFEPPYGPVAPPAMQRHMRELADDTLRAYQRRGSAAAAEVFLAGVSGHSAVDALTPAARARIGRAGAGAVADAALLGMDAAGLSHIQCPVLIATGSASAPLYGAIAEGLRKRIRGAVIERIAGADHMAPITRPDLVAAGVEAFGAR